MSARIELVADTSTAVISPLGASLKTYTVAGRPVVVEMNAFDGAVLAPWPNRIADGRYDFNSQHHQLPITEPARQTALHGLVADAEWTVAERTASSARLETDLSAEDGYPYLLALSITYSLAADELLIVAHARNVGSDPAPFGLGFHPWFSPGGERVNQAQLSLDAQTWFETDDRLIPTRNRRFEESSLTPPANASDCGDSADLKNKDFRALHPINETVLDDAFGVRSENHLDTSQPLPQADISQAHTDGWSRVDGWSQARLKGADGREIVISMDQNFHVWQVCTGDELTEGRARKAIAIEPMTCPPNAFAAGEGYEVIEPGAEFSAVWSIVLK